MGQFVGPGFGWWGGIAPLLFMLVFWCVVVWAVVALCRAGATRAGSGHHGEGAAHPKRDPDDPETILARRYASGEIDEDEFHRRLDHLRSRDPEREKDGIWRP